MRISYKYESPAESNPTYRALEPIHQTLARIMAQNLVERTANSVQDNEAVSGCVGDLTDALTDYQVTMLF